MTAIHHETGHDQRHLALLLNIELSQVMRAIGGPWRIAARDQLALLASRGECFIGRAGPSVALNVDPDTHTVRVGKAVGHWDHVAQLRWHLDSPTIALCMPGSHTEIDQFLSRLAFAVDAAARSKQPSLQVCRYCGEVVAPEYALDEERCHSCATAFFS